MGTKSRQRQRRPVSSEAVPIRYLDPWHWIGRYDDDPAATLDDMPPPTSPEQPQQECRP